MSQLTETIEHRIEREAGARVVVEEDGDDLIVSGPVSSDDQRQAALDIADRSALGYRVRDNMRRDAVEPEEAGGMKLSEVEVAGFAGAAPGTVERDSIEPGDFMDRTPGSDPLAASGAGAAELDEDTSAEGEQAYSPPIDPVGTNSEVIGGFESSSDSLVASMSTSPRGDEELADEARMLLHADSATTDLRVAVEVERGRATLSGRVPTIDESDMAAEVVARVPGIIEVIDNIDVEGGRYV